MNGNTPKRIIIDTDPGIDDALAILLAWASPEVQVEGLTVVNGNVSQEVGLVNAIGIMDVLGAAHIPVAAGATLPLIRPPYRAEDVHGMSGMGYAQLPAASRSAHPQHAVDFLIERVLVAPGEISIVAIGPLTNVALAIRKEPRIVPAIRELVIMGGSISEGGNMSAAAEFNIYVDPHAAHIVFHAGIPTVLVPLDATRRCLLTSEDIERLLQIDSPITRLIADSTKHYMQLTSKLGLPPSCALHDPLALAVAFAPEMVELHSLFVDVDITSDLSMGNTLADRRRWQQSKPNMQVALGVDGRRFVEFFLERLEGLAQR